MAESGHRDYNVEWPSDNKKFWVTTEGELFQNF